MGIYGRKQELAQQFRKIANLLERDDIVCLDQHGSLEEADVFRWFKENNVKMVQLYNFDQLIVFGEIYKFVCQYDADAFKKKWGEKI